MENSEDIPVEIFDWINEFDFEVLSRQQQQLVEQGIGKNEYTALRNAVLQIKQVSPVFRSPGRERVKAKLLDGFDKKFAAPKVVPLYRKSLEIWKVAAIVVLFTGLGWMISTRLKTNNAVNNSQVALTDTVYIEKDPEIKTVVQTDTVYLLAPARKKPAVSGVNLQQWEQSGRIPVNPDAGQVVPVSEIGNVANTGRGNSMKDDSLWRKLTVVTL